MLATVDIWNPKTGVTERVQLDIKINYEELSRKLARKVLASKRGKTELMGGTIKATMR